MKKRYIITVCLLLALILLTGCSSPLIPTSTIRWQDGEETNYTVRLASSAELQLVGINESGAAISSYDVVLPKKANGSYKTNLTKKAQGDTWELATHLSVKEVYAKDDFSTTQYAKATELVSQKDFLSFDEDGNVVVNMVVESKCEFFATGLLPVSSQKTVKSLFVGCGEVAVNDFTTTVSYDYSGKKPVATIQTNAYGQNTTSTTKLAKSDTTKTYDNEQLILLARSFNPETLAANSSTQIQVMDGTANTEATAAVISANSKFSYDCMLGAVWMGTDTEGNRLYKTNDQNQYTDLNNTPLATTPIQRNVAEVSIKKGNTYLKLFFDRKDSDIDSYKSTMVRYQEDYLVMEIDLLSLT